MKRKVEAKRSNAPLFVALCGLALVAGLGTYIMNSPGRTVLKPAPPAAQEQRSGDVKVYTPHYDPKGNLSLKPGLAHATTKEDPRVFAVNQYLAQLSMVPKDARAKACTVRSGVATIDFTSSFDTTYGTEDEQTILKGILTAMSQFPEVRRVLFTVDGKPLSSIGNVDLTDPQPVIPETQTSSGSSN